MDTVEKIQVQDMTGGIKMFQINQEKQARDFAEKQIKTYMGKIEHRIAWVNEEECFAVDLAVNEVLSPTVMMDFVEVKKYA